MELVQCMLLAFFVTVGNEGYFRFTKWNKNEDLKTVTKPKAALLPPSCLAKTIIKQTKKDIGL